MQNHHLHQSIRGWKEFAQDNLEQLLAFEVLLIGCKLDFELLEKSRDLVLLEVHDNIKDAEDGVQAELVECTLKILTLMLAFLCPLLGLWVEV